MLHQTARDYVRAYQEIYKKAESENRRLTPEENSRVAELVEGAQAAKTLESLGHQLGSPTGRLGIEGFGSGPGDVFVASEGYKAIQSSDTRPQTFSSGMIEVSSSSPAMALKGTLLESNSGGPGGGLTPAGYQAGIVSKLLEPLAVAQVFGSSQTSASQMRYVVEGTATSGAAGVAEGAPKPESTLVYSETVEAIRKIATVLPISDEMLEDAPSIQSYINGRLSLFVASEEERQLLRGSGGNELVGVFGRAGINQYTRLAADDNTVAIAKVIANTRGSANLMPDTVVLHPNNWLSTRLLRDGLGGTAGQYFGGGPFGGAYGIGAGAALFGEQIWNTKIVLSTYCGVGTALIGNFSQGAHIWRRGGVSVEATNSHSDYFVKNLTMLRAESRLGLGVYRPGAFTVLSGLT